MTSSRSRARRLAESEALRPVLLIAAVLILWQVAVTVFQIPKYLIPAPTAVIQPLVADWPRLLRESLVTTYATLGGFVLSVAIGVPFAVAIAHGGVVLTRDFGMEARMRVLVTTLFAIWALAVKHRLYRPSCGWRSISGTR